MRKKLLLTLFSALSIMGANAQMRDAIVFDQPANQTAVINKVFKLDAKSIRNENQSKTNGVGGSRYINVVDAMADGNPSIVNNSAFQTIFNDSIGKILYSGNTTGFPGVFAVNDVIFPGDFLFNDKTNIFNDKKINIDSKKALPITVDSVYILGYYNRNDNTVTDSLIINVYPLTLAKAKAYYFTGTTAANHGTDTLTFIGEDYNHSSNELVPQAGSTGVVRKAIALNQARFLDTTSSGLHLFAVPLNLSMTSGDFISLSLSYKYMGAHTLNDTINTKKNTFMPLFYEENAGAFQDYVKRQTWNVTSIANKTSKYNASSGWYDSYIPSYAFTSGAYDLEHLYLDYKITCATCEILSSRSISNVSIGQVYPNPTTNTLNIPYQLTKAAKAKLLVTNALGQVVISNDLGKMNAGVNNMTLNTSNLINGIYVGTIQTEEGSSNFKFTVSK